MNAKELYYRDHQCPSWADEKQWAKLLGKVLLTAQGGISFEKLSISEVKILDGASFVSLLEQRSIHKDERKALLRLQKLEVFTEGRKKGAVSEETKVLQKIIEDNPQLKNNQIARKAAGIKPDLFKEMKPESLAEKISRLRSK